MIETKDKKTIKDFPTTRYQGSKRKILNWLYEHFNGLRFKTVLDAFGGTGSVSYLFKLMGKEVTFNDQLKFNHLIGKALIENNRITLSNTEIASITNLENVEGNKSFIQKNFRDVYFTDQENLWIDKFLHLVNNEDTFGGNPIEIEYKRAISLFALFQASLTKRPYNLFHRKNLYMRLNNVERNFGNKITWERSFEEQVKKFALEANKSVFESENRCRSLNLSAFDLENEDYDLVYIDPPYVDKNGDHDTIDYLYCYHFLEGVSKYDYWQDLIDYETKNLRFKKNFHSNHFKKRNVLESFELLFEKFQDSTIVVSYKANGVPSIKEIETLLTKFKKRVESVSKHYIYALNRQNGNAKENREVIIIGQ